MKLKAKNVLITGASSGFGRQIAVDLAKRGNNIAITARRVQRLDELRAEIEGFGVRCVARPADAIEPDQVRAVLDDTIAELGSVDVALLNAGGGKAMSMASASAQDVLHIARTNYDTLVNFLCPMIEHMKPRGGIIAYTGSPAGYFGLPKSGPYSAAKAAGRTLIDTCRIELADTDIRFVALYPGFAETEGFSPDDVPIKALVISKQRAAQEMIYAIERELPHYMFPKRIKGLMSVARLLPEPLRRRILARVP